MGRAYLRMNSAPSLRAVSRWASGSVRPSAAWWLALPVGLVGLGVAVPLLYLAVRAGSAEPAVLAELLARPRTLRLAGHTLGLTAAVVAVSTALALPLAWLVERTDVPLRRLLAVLGVLPLAIPGYVMAYALLGAGGPTGLLGGLGLPRPSGFSGALAALALSTFPYLFLNLRAALAGLDPALEDAARSLGLGRRAVAWRVVAPQLRPAWMAGALLVALHVLGDFGVVSLMRFETFSYAIYIQIAAAYDRVYAAALALVLVAITGGLLWGEARLLRRFRAERPSGSRHRERSALGVWRWPAFGGAALVAAVSVGVPLATLGFWLGRGTPGAGAAVLAATWDSVRLAGPAALVATLLAVPVAVVGVRRPGGLPAGAARAVERAAYVGYAVPPLAFGLALVVFSLAAAPWAYQTLGLLVAGVALHLAAEAVGPVRSALYRAPVSAEWAARSLGRSAWGAFVGVTLPQLRGGVAAGFAFVFLSAMKELPLTFVLAPLGFRPLAMGVWGAAAEALFAVAAPYALAIVAVSAGLVGLLLRRS